MVTKKNEARRRPVRSNYALRSRTSPARSSSTPVPPNANTLRSIDANTNNNGSETAARSSTHARTRSSSRPVASGHSPPAMANDTYARHDGLPGSEDAASSNSLTQGRQDTTRYRSDEDELASKRSNRTADEPVDGVTSGETNIDLPSANSSSTDSNRSRQERSRLASSSKSRKTSGGITKKKSKKKAKRWSSKKKNSSKNPSLRPFRTFKVHEVYTENPPAGANLVGKYIYLEWPESKKAEWYTCRVVAYNSEKKQHAVVCDYGDEDFALESDADLSSRNWKLIVHDPCAPMWALDKDKLGYWVGRIIYVDPDMVNDSPEDLLAKKAVVLGIKNSGRDKERRGARFTVGKEEVPKVQIMWIHGGGKDASGREFAEGDLQELDTPIVHV